MKYGSHQKRVICNTNWRGVMICMRVFGFLLILTLILTGCTESKKGNTEKLISESEAVKVAQARVQDSKVTWSASYKADEEIEINNVKEKRKVWIIEGTFPGGNKETYRIDAIDGKILVLTETEAPGK